MSKKDLKVILTCALLHALDRTHTEMKLQGGVPRFPLPISLLSPCYPQGPGQPWGRENHWFAPQGPRPQPLVNTQAFNKKATPAQSEPQRRAPWAPRLPSLEESSEQSGVCPSDLAQAWAFLHHLAHSRWARSLCWTSAPDSLCWWTGS